MVLCRWIGIENVLCVLVKYLVIFFVIWCVMGDVVSVFVLCMIVSDGKYFWLMKYRLVSVLFLMCMVMLFSGFGIR